MKKRVFVGGFHHESDTFNPIITGKNDIKVRRGQTLLDMNTKSACCGIISELQNNNIEIIPSLLAGAVPNGEWDKDYYLQLKTEFLDILKKSMPLDGICLALHGSMRIKEIGECEGDLLKEIKKIAPKTPLVASLDMHCTFTKAMFDNCDAYVGYKCAPHTDEFETGQQAVQMLLEEMKTGKKPKMSAVRLPFLVAGEQSETSVEPMKSFTQLLRKIEKDNSEVLAASVLMGFPWADTKVNGVTLLIVTKTD
ncbi:MAG: M81 family metallopeptidase, partial [Sphaerochaetaceae bacterium]